MGNKLYIFQNTIQKPECSREIINDQRKSSKSQSVTYKKLQENNTDSNSSPSKVHHSSKQVNKVFKSSIKLDFFTQYIKDIFISSTKPKILKKSFSCQQKTRSNKFEMIGDIFTRNRSTLNLNYLTKFKENPQKDSIEYELRSIEKNNNLRRAYITKLLVKKVWDPSREKKQFETIFIYDWDDTFFCTSYLSPYNIFCAKEINISKKDRINMDKIEELVIQIITLSLQRGNVFIVTNAESGWVEFSTRNYYKNLYTLLSKVNIISARGLYSKVYPNDSKKWKVEAFLQIQKKFDLKMITNFICMGDSQIEIDASNIFVQNFEEIYLKSIKFRELPRPEDLIKQLKLVCEQFNFIYSTPKNLVFKVERKEKI